MSTFSTLHPLANFSLILANRDGRGISIGVHGPKGCLGRLLLALTTTFGEGQWSQPMQCLFFVGGTFVSND